MLCLPTGAIVLPDKLQANEPQLLPDSCLQSLLITSLSLA